MQLIFIMSAVVLLVPTTLTILKSLNILESSVGNYYDFGVIFKNVKPWTIIIYLGVIIVLSFFTLLIAGAPLLNLQA